MCELWMLLLRVSHTKICRFSLTLFTVFRFTYAYMCIWDLLCANESRPPTTQIIYGLMLRIDSALYQDIHSTKLVQFFHIVSNDLFAYAAIHPPTRKKHNINSDLLLKLKQTIDRSIQVTNEYQQYGHEFMLTQYMSHR